ncbi:MAG: signal peptidase II [Candidatus Dasytiphilus stammeri]
MNLNNSFSYLRLTIIVVMLDFISKQWIIKSFKLGQVISLTPFLNIVYTQNYGVALNFFTTKQGWKFWVLIIIQIILISRCIYIYTVQKSNHLAWALIIAGSLGNCSDRILHGFVIDFIDFRLINNLHFPTFNLADLAICMGIIIILIKKSY